VAASHNSYRVGSLAPLPTPNVENQGISLSLAPPSKPVQHGWPCQQLCCRRHSFRVHWCTQAPSPSNKILSTRWRYYRGVFPICYMLLIAFFTIRVYALNRNLLFIRHQPRQHNLNCTDSLSSLQSLTNYSPDNPVVNEILIKLSHLQKAWKSLVFCWVPGHTGLPGIEAADAVAKAAALHGTLTSDRALGSDVRTFLHRRGKTNGLTHKATNCRWWSHPCRRGLSF
jgi:hypothetical protein